MLQAGRRLGLHLEAPPALVVERTLEFQGLDGDLTLESLVETAVHHAHAAAADSAGHDVATDPRTGPRLERGLGQSWACGSPNQHNRYVIVAAAGIGLVH